MLVIGERLPAVGWGGIALVLACLAVLTAPVGVSGRRREWREGVPPPRRAAVEHPVAQADPAP
ncbi:MULTISPECIES: hypothetical protein [Streptomyces violaceusniger group]|uniref:MFS transporter n=2 Tax=Streptomyces rhizosphaericus TaxID=114699 RepID=A0ABN1NYF3_9ACTN|nr:MULTISPECIES: hypothetical protein [Streptomyces violaceusniger group]